MMMRRGVRCRLEGYLLDGVGSDQRGEDREGRVVVGRHILADSQNLKIKDENLTYHICA